MFPVVRRGIAGSLKRYRKLNSIHGHFLWQAQYFVSLDNDTCNVSRVKRINDECSFSWQVQYLGEVQ